MSLYMDRNADNSPYVNETGRARPTTEGESDTIFALNNGYGV